MELKNMKMPGGEYSGPVEASNGPDYPYGLRLRLSDKAIEKLDLKSLPTVGQTMLLHARVSVVTVSQHESEKHKERSLELQITDMAFSPDISLEQAATKLYGG